MSACAWVLPHSAWHANNRAFGITAEERERLLSAQQGVCAICHSDNPDHLDHDHATGRIRGVLCSKCNMGLGLFDDDPRRIQSAIHYLRRHRAVDAYRTPPWLVVEVGFAGHAA